MDDLIDIEKILGKNYDIDDIIALEEEFKIKIDHSVIRRCLIKNLRRIEYLLGVQDGIIQSVHKLRSKGVLSDEKIAEALNIPLGTVKVL